MADALEADLKKSSLDVRIMGRTKTIPSIHRKLVTQNVTIDQIYDITALRIITDSVRDCYAVLGVIHTLWMPIPGRFKDFVALPKANMYQSIHTTVLGPSGHRVEFQVRTAEMHSVAESGIAAHWLYKEGRPQEEREDERFNWLRQLLEWQKEVLDPKEYMHTLRTDLFQEEVYVFTPNGRVIELPRDATPVDFAYLIHTDIGNHCAGAKVNGKMVPLKRPLENGEIVEIITSPHRKPSRDWLKFVKTGRARSKIRAYLRSEEKERALGLGREILEKELTRYAVKPESGMLKERKLGEAARSLGLPSAEELFPGPGFRTSGAPPSPVQTAPARSAPGSSQGRGTPARAGTFRHGPSGGPCQGEERRGCVDPGGGVLQSGARGTHRRLYHAGEGGDDSQRRLPQRGYAGLRTGPTGRRGMGPGNGRAIHRRVAA